MGRPTRADAEWAVAIVLSLPLIVVFLPLLLWDMAAERLTGRWRDDGRG